MLLKLGKMRSYKFIDNRGKTAWFRGKYKAQIWLLGREALVWNIWFHVGNRAASTVSGKRRGRTNHEDWLGALILKMPPGETVK